MTFLAKLAAIIAAPFLVLAAHFGIGAHIASTTPAYTASVTASTTASTTVGWKAPHSHPMIPYVPPATATPSAAISLTPMSGAVGTSVTITGTGFTNASLVHFGPGVVRDTTVSANGTSITFSVPGSIGPYCEPDRACPMFEMLVTPNTYSVYVTTGSTTSPNVQFTVTGTSSALQPLGVITRQ